MFNYMIKMVKLFLDKLSKTLSIKPKAEVRYLARPSTPAEEDLASFVQALKHRPLRNKSNI
jgi:hypothetical protein